MAASIYAVLAHQLGLWTFTWLVVLALLSMLAFNLASVPERNLGHRAGGKGFRGEAAEGMSLLSWANFVAALRPKHDRQCRECCLCQSHTATVLHCLTRQNVCLSCMFDAHMADSKQAEGGMPAVTAVQPTCVRAAHVFLCCRQAVLDLLKAG